MPILMYFEFNSKVHRWCKWMLLEIVLNGGTIIEIVTHAWFSKNMDGLTYLILSTYRSIDRKL